MAFVTPKTAYRLWDQNADRYDAFQFVGNWRKADAHSHKPGQGVQIPNEGFAAGGITTKKLDSILASNAGIGVRQQAVIPDVVTVTASPPLGSIFPTGFNLGGPSITLDIPAKSFLIFTVFSEVQAPGGNTGIVLNLNEDEDAVFPMLSYPTTTWGTATGSNFVIGLKPKVGVHTYSITYNSFTTTADFRNRRLSVFARSVA